MKKLFFIAFGILLAATILFTLEVEMNSPVLLMLGAALATTVLLFGVVGFEAMKNDNEKEAAEFLLAGTCVACSCIVLLMISTLFPNIPNMFVGIGVMVFVYAATRYSIRKLA